eukprot:755998-Pelagomonas_calceolata.AAC.3
MRLCGKIVAAEATHYCIQEMTLALAECLGEMHDPAAVSAVSSGSCFWRKRSLMVLTSFASLCPHKRRTV